MTNVDSNRNVAAGALAGGLVGAAAGSISAPSVLGKIDLDRALTPTPYTDVVRDRIAKLGEAGRDLFVKQRAAYIDQVREIDSYVLNIIPGEGDKTVTGKDLKNLVLKYDTDIKNGNLAMPYKCVAANVYREAIEKLDDAKEFNQESLKAFMRENSETLKCCKKTIQEYLGSLPKQTGKYAAIFATVGALVTGALAYILNPSDSNKNA